MEFKELMTARRSCRAYLDEPVPLALVEEIVAQAQGAPSWGNTQPWQIFAAGGEVARAIRRDNVAALQSGREAQPDFDMPDSFPDAQMRRYRGLGMDLFQVLGIGRGDKDKRQAHYANNFNAFGAPAMLFLTAAKDSTPYALFDCGAMAFSLCLAAAEKGLGTCIAAALARYPDMIRRHLPLPEDQGLVMGIALGRPDPAAAVNQFRSGRAGLGDVLTAQGW